jgi:hypothetical protein
MSVLLSVTVLQFIFKLLFLLAVAAIVCPNKCYLLTQNKAELDKTGKWDKSRVRPNGEAGETGCQALNRVRRNFLQTFCRVNACAESQHYRRVDVTIEPLPRCKGGPTACCAPRTYDLLFISLHDKETASFVSA